MMYCKMLNRLISRLLALALILSLFPVGPAAAQGQAFDADAVQRATVLIMQVYTNPLGQTVLSCVGSGTLVSQDGLILTNAHVALPIAGCRSDRIAVALTLRQGEAPVVTYYAEVVVSNIGWDLAVLQVTRTIYDRPVDRNSLVLPFVDVGDSEAVTLDSTIEVVGYAPPEHDEVANSVSQVIRGTVSGFTAESRVGDRAWIKTRAALPGSMTGGGAYNSAGQLIGVPTVEPASSGRTGGESPNCRRIQDTNGDGRVDEQDLCVPVSGLINALRPSRLARGLILAAKLGITPQAQLPIQADQTSAASPKFSRLFFAPGVDLAGMPTSVVYSVPTGLSQLYLFFDYENMADGMIYELRVTRDNTVDPVFSLAPATWSGGQRGLWYIGSTAQVWPNGNYEFILFIEGTRVASATITVGGQVAQAPQFSHILFGVLNPNNELVSTGNILPVSNTLNAEFAYNNLAAGMAWRQVWYYDGVQISAGTGEWESGANGKQAVNASAPPDKPLQPGRYRLELYINDRLSATSDFIMAGGEVSFNTEIFSSLTFSSELQDKPAGIIGTTFPNTIASLYAIFDWRDVAQGTPITWRWTVDANPLFEYTQPWSNAATGTGAWLRLNTRGRLPDGSYKVELLVSGVVKASATAKVGIGQLPVAIFAVTQGVRVQGQILDAETGKGIPGVSIIVLKPEFQVRDFTWQMTEVFDIAYTDTEGQFAISKPLAREKTYSLIVLATTYLPTSTDGIEVRAQTPSPITLRIELSRD